MQFVGVRSKPSRPKSISSLNASCRGIATRENTIMVAVTTKLHWLWIRMHIIAFDVVCISLLHCIQWPDISFPRVCTDNYVLLTLKTYWGRVTHICVRELGHHWFMQWLVASTWTNAELLTFGLLGTQMKLWSKYLKSFQENAFENIKTSATLFWPQCVIVHMPG